MLKVLSIINSIDKFDKILNYVPENKKNLDFCLLTKNDLISPYRMHIKDNVIFFKYNPVYEIQKFLETRKHKIYEDCFDCFSDCILYKKEFIFTNSSIKIPKLKTWLLNKGILLYTCELIFLFKIYIKNSPSKPSVHGFKKMILNYCLKGEITTLVGVVIKTMLENWYEVFNHIMTIRINCKQKGYKKLFIELKTIQYINNYEKNQISKYIYKCIHTINIELKRIPIVINNIKTVSPMKIEEKNKITPEIKETPYEMGIFSIYHLLKESKDSNFNNYIINLMKRKKSYSPKKRKKIKNILNNEKFVEKEQMNIITFLKKYKIYINNKQLINRVTTENLIEEKQEDIIYFNELNLDFEDEPMYAFI